MDVVGEVKKATKSKWVLLVVGIILGGTVLAGAVALIVSKVRGLTGSVANNAAALAAGK